MEIHVNKIPVTSMDVWTIGRDKDWFAFATIRRRNSRGGPYYDVTVAPPHKALRDAYPKIYDELKGLTMDGFCSFDAARVWCKEWMQTEYPS